jgi:hypothetical protein
LRQNYHDQLKAIPQYEAYLQVGSTTEKAAAALHTSADSPASIAAEVIDSLQFARNRFEQHLNSLPEYRTLLAIDRLVREVSIDLGIARPEPTDAADVAEAAVAPTAPEHDADGAVASLPEPALQAAPIAVETVAPSPADAPVQPPHVTIDLDGALAEDDIVPVHEPRGESSIEGGADEDLLEIAYRDMARATAESASAGDADVFSAASPSHVFSQDSDEAA